MVRTYEAMIGIFQVGLERYYCFLADVFDGFLEMANVLTLLNQIFQNTSIQLFRRFVISLELLPGCLESLRVFIQAKVGQMHVEVFYIVIVWFFVVVGAETG